MCDGHAIHVGAWRIHQDAPAFGCDDNPSYDWFAFEYSNGHWTGRTLRKADLAELKTACGAVEESA